MNRTIHELKIYPKYFKQILEGKKTFEIRKGDRGFCVFDQVILKEWDNIEYSGREILVEITYLLLDNFIGLQSGYVAFSFKVLRSN